METVFFYYTVIVIAVCLSTALSALGALVITDNKKFRLHHRDVRLLRL